MEYDRILKIIVEQSPGKWWRNYPPIFYEKPLPSRTIKGYLRNIFSAKKTNVFYNKRIPLRIVRRYLQNIFSRENTKDIGLYIHIPFCPSRCYFCAYYSKVIHNKEIMAEYLESLEKELLSYRVDYQPHSLQSVYIGGGTPTFLDEQSWKKIFKIVNRFFRIDNDAQIATEGTPETCTYSKLKLLKDLGVNRFSIGAQTFDDKILSSFNRRHSVSDIYIAFENARKVNFKYLNVDLLFGLPGETEETFFKTLKHIVALKPDCISPAFLWFNKNVLFSKEEAKNAYVTRDQSDAKSLLQISKFLKPFGYRNIINGVYYQCFFLNGQIQVRNKNIIPKGSSGSTFSLGCSSRSYLNYSSGKCHQLQYLHEADIKEYISRLKKCKDLFLWGVELPEDEIIRQYLVHCFVFLKGRINKKYFFSRFKKELMPYLKANFSRLLNDNKFTETQEDVCFHQKDPYSFVNRKALLLFCLKYLYSSKILNGIEELARGNNNLIQ